MKTLILLVVLVSLVGCAPVPPEPIPPGIHITVEPGAVGFTESEVDRAWVDVSICVAQYVQPPNFNIVFQPDRPLQNGVPIMGLATYNPNSGRIDVKMFMPVGFSMSSALQTLRHEFVHVALFYYGVVDQYTHGEHASVKFSECGY